MMALSPPLARQMASHHAQCKFFAFVDGVVVTHKRFTQANTDGARNSSEVCAEGDGTSPPHRRRIRFFFGELLLVVGCRGQRHLGTKRSLADSLKEHHNRWRGLTPGAPWLFRRSQPIRQLPKNQHAPNNNKRRAWRWAAVHRNTRSSPRQPNRGT